MLNGQMVKKISDFVYSRPRSIQEIADHISKNWRTADKYIEEIEKELGIVSTHVFRQGTRGALKVVFWSSLEKASHSVFQEELEKKLFLGRNKSDFFAFDIFQHVGDNTKDAWIRNGKDEVRCGRLIEFKQILLKAKKQVLFFSGNLSFVSFQDNRISLFNTVEELVKQGISIKILCRVDIASVENVNKLLSLNYKYGKDLIEIRHREQPLRAVIVDNSFFNMEEIRDVRGRSFGLKEKTYIFYTVRDKDWVSWLSRIFWKMYNSSVRSDRRVEELRKIRVLSY